VYQDSGDHADEQGGEGECDGHKLLIHFVLSASPTLCQTYDIS